MTISIATWNINSVRLRLDMVLQFLKDHQPDVLCLQEIKCPDELFPVSDFIKAGYPHIALKGQKAYHGVATISKLPVLSQNSIDFCQMGHARHVSAEIKGHKKNFHLHNFYVPAGGDEPNIETNDKFAHKMQFLAEMRDLFKSKAFSKPAIILGDINIAPHENDVWSHKKLLKIISHTPLETDTLDTMRDETNWVDIVRSHIPVEEKIFSWWSYRARDWDAADKGRRLDHIWATPDIGDTSKSVEILRDARGWEPKPSDHVPIIATFDL